MNPIERLKADAALKRDTAIHKARMDYRLAMREIRAVARLLREPGTPKPRPESPRIRPAVRDSSFRTLTAINAAETVLREGTPLTLVELVIELQSRGCRSSDDPRALLHAIRSAFAYHRDKFLRDCEDRWTLVS
jgi:hypothetical protein